MDFLFDIIYLTRPIGWNELGVIVTFLAVLVALWANKKATEQLKASLDMQEQSKNVALLDRRIEMLENVRVNKFVPELTLQVLFDDNILQHYKEWKTSFIEKCNAESDLNTYFLFGMMQYPDESVEDTILHYQHELEKPDCSKELSDEYETYCNSHIVTGKSGEDGKVAAYNCLEINNRLSQAHEEAQAEQKETVRLMKDFVAESIKKVSSTSKTQFTTCQKCPVLWLINFRKKRNNE